MLTLHEDKQISFGEWPWLFVQSDWFKDTSKARKKWAQLLINLSKSLSQTLCAHLRGKGISIKCHFSFELQLLEQSGSLLHQKITVCVCAETVAIDSNLMENVTWSLKGVETSGDYLGYNEFTEIYIYGQYIVNYSMQLWCVNDLDL